MNSINTILLIDDIDTDLFIHERVLKFIGYDKKLLKFTTVQQALSMLKLCTYDEFPEIILLDINMPGMNGYEFLEKYKFLNKEKKEKCKVIILTSSVYRVDLENMKKNPDVHSLILKPLNLDDENLLQLFKN